MVGWKWWLLLTDLHLESEMLKFSQSWNIIRVLAHKEKKMTITTGPYTNSKFWAPHSIKKKLLSDQIKLFDG